MTNEREISECLLRLGIPCNLLGFRYLKFAVDKAVQDESWTDKMTKRVYPQLAKEFNTSVSKVERAIKHAVDTAWDRGEKDLIKSIFFVVDEKPSNSQFICTVAEYLRLRN